jgi:hypothetical protein
MLAIAEHLDRKMLEFVAKNLETNGFSENDQELAAHKVLMDKIRALH